LSASITRLATLADGGRISAALVQAELQRLRARWRPASTRPPALPAVDLALLLPPERLDGLDLFDRLQLQAVIAVCRQCKTLSEAGRRLFQHSRGQKSVVNDADRLRKYLGKWGLRWEARVSSCTNTCT